MADYLAAKKAELTAALKAALTAGPKDSLWVVERVGKSAGSMAGLTAEKWVAGLVVQMVELSVAVTVGS